MGRFRIEQSLSHRLKSTEIETLLIFSLRGDDERQALLEDSPWRVSANRQPEAPKSILEVESSAIPPLVARNGVSRGRDHDLCNR
jgi:hypothetical protein